MEVISFFGTFVLSIDPFQSLTRSYFRIIDLELKVLYTLE